MRLSGDDFMPAKKPIAAHRAAARHFQTISGEVTCRKLPVFERTATKAAANIRACAPLRADSGRMHVAAAL
jgi:hypothetical protein